MESGKKTGWNKIKKKYRKNRKKLRGKKVEQEKPRGMLWVLAVDGRKSNGKSTGMNYICNKEDNVDATGHDWAKEEME